MLPLRVQFIIAMVAHAINERMARRIDYLALFQNWIAHQSRSLPVVVVENARPPRKPNPPGNRG